MKWENLLLMPFVGFTAAMWALYAAAIFKFFRKAADGAA
jgi:hypothetical protein